ncbi:hypothetical protein AXE80_06730 [Wenyingzhuangia fucanilytica]|uniref:BioF2-like acetyltransferase domain-containing protein n=1 Tax=Wenyingzhuangia fucanilytica TaxID=1790137 RepID=A0A1B1Y5F6_9FLAO|nr:hypothetical protein [Wenyingzhuangia fucanilytica]ANW95993.1 hypothetical protein AXE80_06730 [Wenyingzhuangia fucanilytica]
MKLTPYSLDNHFSYKFSFTIDEVLQDWSNIQHTNLYLSASYLKAIEQSKIPYLSFVYVVIYKKEIPVGIMYFQCLEITNGFYFQDTFPQEINKRITTKLLKKLCGNLMMCGNFFATGVNGYVLNKEVSPHLIYDVIKSLKITLKNDKTPLDFSFLMFKEFWKHQEIDLQKRIQSKKLTAFEIDVNMVLYLKPHWNTFKEYLEEMTTKYRTRAKSVYKKTVSVREQLLTAEEINKHKSIIRDLYLSVVKTASFNMVEFSTDSFYQFKKELKEDFVFKAYFQEDKMIAFSTACFTDGCLDANYVGINYDINNTIPLYQRILYDYVQLAIHHQVKELRLGRTAEMMKSSLGAKPVGMYLYLKHTNKVVNTIIKPLIKSVKPSEYELRNPFKDKVKT